MDVFDLRERVIGDCESFVSSFLQFRDGWIETRVGSELADGHLWPEPRLGLNPEYQTVLDPPGT